GLGGALGGAAGTDVTGGMRHRVETALDLADLGIPSLILDGREAGLLERALAGEAVPGKEVGLCRITQPMPHSKTRRSRPDSPPRPRPPRRAATLACLLCRLRAACEAAPDWPREPKIAALEHFGALLDGEGRRAETAAAAARWQPEAPCPQPAYRELLAEPPA